MYSHRLPEVTGGISAPESYTPGYERQITGGIELAIGESPLASRSSNGWKALATGMSWPWDTSVRAVPCEWAISS